MYSQTQFKRLKENVDNISLTSGLNDTQIDWVKDKITQVGVLVDQATAAFTTVNSRLVTLETAVSNATAYIEAAFTTVNSRLTALETKANKAVTKFASLDSKIAAIEARLTAHHI